MPLVHKTFLDAFADYVVPIQLTEEQFQAKIKREGIEPSFCVAAYAGDEMAGFILTGLGEWKGKPTAYNAGTGVKPAFRGQKLTQRLYAFMLPKLRESSIEQCLLEVIQDNKPALASYRRVGMHITRPLLCYRALKQDILLQPNLPDGVTLVPVSRPDWQLFKHLRDVEPSWQNNSIAIKRSVGEYVVVEAVNAERERIGVIAFFPKLGSVAQLAVDLNWRGQGVGAALLHEAIKQVHAPAIMFINVDETAQSMISFLERRHFKLILKQYEMLMELT